MSSNPDDSGQADVRPALLVVMSGPSGCGKTTLCERLVAAVPEMQYSVSCTTRPAREGEVDGRDYVFLTPEQFAEVEHAGAFLEHAVVHGHSYGTPREAVLEALSGGADVLLDVDVQGAEQLRHTVSQAPAGDVLRRAYMDVFIAPPSLTELRNRLESRGKDSAEVIARRLHNAEREIEASSAYAHCIVNDDLDESFAQLLELINNERALRTSS